MDHSSGLVFRRPQATLTADLWSIFAPPFSDTLEAHLELLRCYYNFVRPHGALKFGRETRTPAMQAGLATRRLTLRDIFVSLRRVVWWLSDVRVFANPRRRAAAAVTYMPVAA